MCWLLGATQFAFLPVIVNKTEPETNPLLFADAVSESDSPVTDLDISNRLKFLQGLSEIFGVTADRTAA